MGTMLSDILTGIGDGLSNFAVMIVKAIATAFSYLVYVDPTATTKEYNVLFVYVLIGFVVAMTFWIVSLCRRLVKFGKKSAS